MSTRLEDDGRFETSGPANRADPSHAAQVWSQLKSFVEREDRRQDVHLQLGIGASRARLLIYLSRGPMTLSEIAHSAGIDAPAATVGVNELQRRGLVRRGPHPDDNRRKLVGLTAAGATAAATAQHILEDPPTPLTTLNQEKLCILSQLLSDLDQHSASSVNQKCLD